MKIFIIGCRKQSDKFSQQGSIMAIHYSINDLVTKIFFRTTKT
jgi:hypothetical protein